MTGCQHVFGSWERIPTNGGAQDHREPHISRGRQHSDRIRDDEGPGEHMSDSIHIGDWEFDHWFYDAEADVAYLSIGEPRPAVGEETAEGHIVRFDADTGEFCGLRSSASRRSVDRQRVIKRDGTRCHLCGGKKAEPKLQGDRHQTWRCAHGFHKERDA